MVRGWKEEDTDPKLIISYLDPGDQIISDPGGSGTLIQCREICFINYRREIAPEEFGGRITARREKVNI